MSAPFVLEQLEPRGELIVSGAPADRAAEIVAEARSAAAAIEAQARSEGFEQGLAEGRGAAAEELAAVVGALEAAVAGVHAAHEDFVGLAESHAVELAIAIAEKIVGAALAVEPARVCDVVAGALRRVTEHDRLVLEVNPEDTEIVRSWVDTTANGFWSTVVVRDDRRVPRGGCVVRTTHGEIDARVTEQLAVAEQLLRDALAGRP